MLLMPAAVGAGIAVIVAVLTRDILYGLAIWGLVLLGGVAGWLLRRRRPG
jgi:LPXTG-motif cell wall-anchored protein